MSSKLQQKQAEIEELKKRVHELENRLKRVDSISRRKLKAGETLYELLSMIRIELEKENKHA